MADQDCAELHARAEMLRHEARHGRVKARKNGPEWNGYTDQVKIVQRVESMAQRVEEKIEEEC